MSYQTDDLKNEKKQELMKMTKVYRNKRIVLMIQWSICCDTVFFLQIHYIELKVTTITALHV